MTQRRQRDTEQLLRPEFVHESGIKFLLLPKTMFGKCLDVNIILFSGSSSIWGLPTLKLTVLLLRAGEFTCLACYRQGQGSHLE